jgi:hypothetical protein
LLFVTGQITAAEVHNRLSRRPDEGASISVEEIREAGTRKRSDATIVGLAARVYNVIARDCHVSVAPDARVREPLRRLLVGRGERLGIPECVREDKAHVDAFMRPHIERLRGEMERLKARRAKRRR